MDKRISDFLNILDENLKELPVDERQKALLYYDEYMNDALESGKNLDEVINKLGSPEDIAALIRAEAALSLAQKRPGVRNFNRAMKNTFHGVSTPFGFIARGLFLLIVYALLIIFLCGALVFLIGAIISFSVLLFEMFKISPSYVMERLGTLGIALLLSALLLVISFSFFRFSQWLIRSASKTLSRMMKKRGEKEDPEPKPEENRKKRDKVFVGICSGIMVLGLVLVFSSGLPVKLFQIFNSSRPENINVNISEYNPEEVRNIDIKTAHSCIRVLNGTNAALAIVYEQPDWLTGRTEINNGTVTFLESSNKRLPLFDLISLHESRTEVILYLPQGLMAEDITLESRGGFINIEDVVQNIKAKTYTGKITLEVSDIPYKLNAKTGTGILNVKGAYPKTRDYSEITINQQNAERSFRLESSRGDITVK